MEDRLMEEEMMEVGMTEEGSCLERKNPVHFSAQTEKWIKEGKVLPLREWVKQELPEGLKWLESFNETRRGKTLYVFIKNRKIDCKIIGRA